MLNHFFVFIVELGHDWVPRTLYVFSKMVFVGNKRFVKELSRVSVVVVRGQSGGLHVWPSDAEEGGRRIDGFDLAHDPSCTEIVGRTPGNDAYR